MKIAIHQPNFLPNLGFFHKMNKVDAFIVITQTQYERQEGWQRRHKIKNKDQDIWLTVPVVGSRRQLIKEVKIDNTQNWSYIQQQSLQFSYGKTKYKDLLNQLKAVYDENWERLVDLNFALIKLLKEILGIPAELIFDEEVGGEKHELLINVCRKYNASCYLSGVGGKEYMTDMYFNEMAEHNIDCEFFEYNTTASYPYSSVHYLLTEGPDWIKQVIAA